MMNKAPATGAMNGVYTELANWGVCLQAQTDYALKLKAVSRAD